MDATVSTRVISALKCEEAKLLEDWLREQLAAPSLRPDLMDETQLRQESSEFLATLLNTMQVGELDSLAHASWRPVRDLLVAVSRRRMELGFSTTETATFVFSLKQPFFTCLQQHLAGQPAELTGALWGINVMLDKLGLYTVELYQKSREEIIAHQRSEILELSTPVVKLWDGVLAVPLIGVLDSARTQVVMESLLQELAVTGSEVAIIDITGVPIVDTVVAQHLMKTVAAARLMGAECIISGIRPQIAQTIVQLGVGLNDVATKGTLASAFSMALQRMGLGVKRTGNST